jgi:hypothetical protein
MQRPLRLSVSLAGTAALALASLPLAIRPAAAAEPKAESTEAADLGVMGVNLRDAVKLNYGFQGALQGAGTPNQAGVGAFIPLHVGSNSVAFVDVLVNANFKDYSGYSSIINTTVAGTTISTSSRLGYRWLNGDRSWMYGINAGYDTRPMSTGPSDTGIPVYASRTAFFQQAAVNAEAVSEKWRFNAYGLIPTGEEDHQLNSVYKGGALTTVGLDAGYSITPSLLASLGGYYQNGDLDDDGNPEVDNVGILGRLAYAINNEVSIGANLSYDASFDTRFSADIKWRFNTNGGPRKERPKSNAAIKALTSTPSNRDVRVHDYICNPEMRWNDCGNWNCRRFC